MKEETLKRIFEFLEENEGHKTPFLWKLKNNELSKEDLNIKGDLNLGFTAITSLPKGLKVEGDLYLVGSKIKSLPERLYIKGNLNLSLTNIELLPDNLYVGGSLWARFSYYIKDIPKKLYVGGNLYIQGTPISKYTDEEIRRNKNLNGGKFEGKIDRSL